MHDTCRNGSALSRRGFAAGLAAAAAATAAAPASARARRLADETIIGEGEHRFRVKHHFPQLPDPFTCQVNGSGSCGK